MNDLTLPEIDPRDIEQDAELIKLEGKTPNRALILKRYQRRTLTFTQIDTGASLISAPPISPAASQQIFQWAIKQDEDICSRVLNFLDEPGDLDDLLKFLKSKGVPLYVDRVQESLVDLILRALPAKREDLYQLARESHQAERPEAAVRQVLRRLSRNHTIKEEGDHVYRNG